MKLIVSDKNITINQIITYEELEIDSSENYISHINDGHNFLLYTINSGISVYGTTTGYGDSGRNSLPSADAMLLQKNLYTFHGCGVGKKLNIDEVKYTMLMRLISIAKGFSGISYELLLFLKKLIDLHIFPVIPEQGSVGASGDLTPLSYVAAVMAGEREVYYDGKVIETSIVFLKLNIQPYVFKPKEALAIMNGTSVMSAISLCAIQRFQNWFNAYITFNAGLLEVLSANDIHLQPLVHQIKPFKGQISVADKILKKISGSKYINNYNDKDANIQDPYSLRCSPQILGVVEENINISMQWIECEINSVNDNPIFDVKNKKTYNGGNFYGGYIAHAMDTLKISAANTADLLDKQFALLVDHKFNRGLGENLKLKNEAYYHGFKAMQITLSSLSADVLMNTNASSVFSRSTESMNQDKVSMGTTAAIQFRNKINDLENMLSIALLGLAQAIDIKTNVGISPALKKLHNSIREEVSPLKEDRRMDKDIEKIVNLIRRGMFD